ncbi:uncharacterized protein LOC101859053 [Aplysia californica]|uniref:Uncharacterized protein LOC101859053 n=1 Tax=Aplysia californica TaxID=6500 RepID=A0ABM0K8B8_APLCA|nr:uncharacterized protein LOC101859053 [Aplysia californica]
MSGFWASWNYSRHGRCLRFSFLVISVLLVLQCEGVGKEHFHSFQKTYNTTTSFTVTPSQNGCPLKTTVYYPVAGGSFSPIYFIGGFGGVQPAETYSELLSKIASNGYVVMGIDRFSLSGDLENELWTRPSERTLQVDKSSERFACQIQWLRKNIDTVPELHGTLHSPNWNKTTLMCHSKGCDVILKILENNIAQVADMAKAAIYLDPFSIHSRKAPKVKVRIPSFSYLSALSEKFPTCCIKGFGYRRFYDLMPCVKVKMDVQGFGHCDLLDYKYWELCHKIGFCVTTNDTRLEEYKNFLQKEVTSFLSWTLDGVTEVKKYLTDPKYIPFPLLDLAYNETKCE